MRHCRHYYQIDRFGSKSANSLSALLSFSEMTLTPVSASARSALGAAVEETIHLRRFSSCCRSGIYRLRETIRAAVFDISKLRTSLTARGLFADMESAMVTGSERRPVKNHCEALKKLGISKGQSSVGGCYS